MAASMGRGLLLPVLLGLVAEAAGGVGPGPSRDDDLLLPYPRRRARSSGDADRPRALGGEHESWPASRAPGGPAVRAFVSAFRGGRMVSGHLTRAGDPLRTFSVLEPGGPGGCAARRRVTVEDTARAAGCRVAQNGGFFAMLTGECLGDVVSGGRRVNGARGLRNAHFGIRRDGSLVTGYLSEEEVQDTENPFVQLLSGVVWLIRNGSVYINESLATESSETQETGSFLKFINVLSARTAIGHDREGQLVLFHVDGQTEQRGLNLWEMADFLLQLGVVNAINLDGGGSATFVLNGSLASYPSDHCIEDNMWRCARAVSTVVCVHEPHCQPPDCSGHGTCEAGLCRCTRPFWAGPACDQLDCGPSNCSSHGRCTEAGCHCEAGWMGSNCSEACANDTFGENCAQRCMCQNGAACDPVQGSCSCPPGFTGDTCAHECTPGWHGPGCQQPCSCEHQCPCDPRTGNCSLSGAPALSNLLSQVKQCLHPPESTLHTEELALLPGPGWLALTLLLVFLLLLSVVANVCLVLSARAERRRHLDGDYAYHPLQEMSGDLLARDKEQPAGTHNPFND